MPRRAPSSHGSGVGTRSSSRSTSKRRQAVDEGVARFYNKNGTISAARVMNVFGMSKQQLADTLGLRASVLAQDTAAIRSRAAEMVEIVHRIQSWAGGEAQAIAWYKAEPLAGFGGRTAESLVKEGKAGAVRDYLDHIATGGFA